MVIAMNQTTNYSYQSPILQASYAWAYGTVESRPGSCRHSHPGGGGEEAHEGERSLQTRHRQGEVHRGSLEVEERVGDRVGVV